MPDYIEIINVFLGFRFDWFYGHPNCKIFFFKDILNTALLLQCNAALLNTAKPPIVITNTNQYKLLICTSTVAAMC